MATVIRPTTEAPTDAIAASDTNTIAPVNDRGDCVCACTFFDLLMGLPARSQTSQDSQDSQDSQAASSSPMLARTLFMAFFSI